VSADLHAIASARLLGAGQRYTGQRRRLLELLARTPRPRSLPEILRSSRGLKQSSTYRNLAVLEQAGLVRRVITEGEFARYELTEDITHHHHHLICSNCGRVEDAAIPAGFERTLDRTLDELARQAGFATVEHRLDLIGICRSCSERRSGGRGAG
jgi:Fur family ferric uptake transcriptional regulator